MSSRLALLWYSLNPLFCELARLPLEPFAGKFSLSFFLWQSHCLNCYLMLAPSDCPQGFQVQALPYGRVKQPVHPIHPLLTGGRHKRLGHCSTHSWGSHSVLLLLLLFFLLVMLPSAIPKLPMDRPVRGFPTVWKLLFLHDSLRRMGLHP